MPRRHTPPAALVVRYFREQPLDVVEQVLAVCADVVATRLAESGREGITGTGTLVPAPRRRRLRRVPPAAAEGA